MAFTINTVAISGNLTEQAKMPTENFMTFTVAVNNQKKTSEGQWVDDPAFIPCTLSGAMAKAILQQMQKGSFVCVQGAIVQNNWIDKQTGQKRSKLQLRAQNVTLGNKHLQSSKPVQSSELAQGGAHDGFGYNDSDIPF